MRRVKVLGTIHEIPDDQEYVVQDMEMKSSTKRVLYQFRFFPQPRTEVQVLKQVMDIGYSANPADDIYASEWQTCPSQHIHDYLVIEEPHWTQNPARELSRRRTYESYYDHPFPKNGDAASQREMYERYTSPLTGRTKSTRQENKKRSTWKPMFDDKVFEGFSGVDMEKFLGHPEEFLKAKESSMGKDHKWVPGDRLFYVCPVDREEKRGTLVGKVPEMRGKCPPGTLLVCTDQKDENYVNGNEYTGDCHGLYVPIKHLRPAEEPQWSTVPQHIGVYVPESFSFDGIKFRTGVTGRILHVYESTDQILISWNFEHDAFSPGYNDQETLYHNTFYVPIQKVRMCSRRRTGTKNKPWPSASLRTAPKRKVGDICTVDGRSVCCIDKKGKEKTLPAACVVKLVQNNGGSNRDRSWTCEILGNCDDSLIGVFLNIQARYLKAHPDPESLYLPGQQIEIVAKVDFRKKPLQGMQGKVILMTDSDGDVGIEFPDDIGAGSLDGIGKEGHCIYIEAQDVKSSE